MRAKDKTGAFATLVAGLLLMLALPAPATVITVDIAGSGDFASIQDGIDAASPGDTVLVLPGTYFETPYIGSTKDGITLRSSGGAELTIVDSDHTPATAVLTCEDVGASTLVEGFTIMGGSGIGTGAGISCINASPAISHNIITDCFPASVQAEGGGLGVRNGSPHIHHNTIVANNGSDGAGVMIWGGAPLVEANNITDNNGWGFGGNNAGAGIAAWEASPQIVGNTISHNDASYAAGIALVDCSDVLLADNTILGNTVAYWGGALDVVRSSVTATGNRFIQNEAGGIGACLRLSSVPEGSVAVFEDNVFFGNVGPDQAIAVNDPRARFSGNYLVDACPYQVSAPTCTTPDSLDFTGNWWGSADSASIEALVFDATDDPGRCVIDFSEWCLDPSCTGTATTVPEQQELSWGRLKSLYAAP